MDKRQELILETIIKEHINTGIPVSSSVLVEKYKLNISSATVRNEMSTLERDGYIIQPHTSAGRIPSEDAYVLYVEKLQNTSTAKPKKISAINAKAIDDAFDLEGEKAFRETAKQISQLSGNAVFWAFHKHNLYYTGISNLFQQPEFSRINIIYDISEVIDRLDEIINSTIEEIELGLHTQIGSNNPFGSIFGSTFVKYKANGKTGMFGVLGPMRMDYEKTISLLDYVDKKISSH